MATVTFAQLCQMKYKDQAIWFMNGFWADQRGNAEQIYEWIQHFIKLDKQQTPPKGADGNELDQFWSAKFIEDKDQALTAIQRKEALKTIDVDSNGRMSAIEYIVWKFKADPDAVCRAPQGDNQAALAAAQRKLDSVMAALEETQRKIEEARVAIEQSKKAQAELAVAEQECAAAVAELQAQEAAYAKKIADLEALSNDQSVGTVKRNKAANELAQTRAEDPLPLRRAKLTAEAALKKVQRQQVIAAQRRAEAEAAEAALTKAYSDLEVKLDEAQRELAEVQRAGGSGGQGGLWWIGRELYEADCSLPKSKQKYDHSRPFQFTGR